MHTCCQYQTDGMMRDVKLGRTTDSDSDTSSNNNSTTTSTTASSIMRDAAYATVGTTINSNSVAKLSRPAAVSDSYFDDVDADSSSSDTDSTDSDSDSDIDDEQQQQQQLSEQKQQHLQEQQQLLKEQQIPEPPQWNEAELRHMSVSYTSLLF
jgi:hypothetical protein